MVDLTVAVPTYNRSKRLRKCLLDLLDEIKSSDLKGKVSVCVRNNGSTDNSEIIIQQAQILFRKNCIPFQFESAAVNQGFDANVHACYAMADGKYIWFLSDDDNICSGAIDRILNDIYSYAPTVIYYNFDQVPYDKDNPYIESVSFYEMILFDQIEALSKIVAWPKLTSCVIKRCKAGLQVPNLNTGFAHVALALQCGLCEGKILHQTFFIAFPDNDYLDQVDFPPYIGNYMKLAVNWVLINNDKLCLIDRLLPKYISPLASSLDVLSSHYRGQRVLSIHLKNELWNTVKSSFNLREFNMTILKSLAKFAVSISFFWIVYIFTRKKLAMTRQ